MPVRNTRGTPTARKARTVRQDSTSRNGDVELSVKRIKQGGDPSCSEKAISSALKLRVDYFSKHGFYPEEVFLENIHDVAKVWDLPFEVSNVTPDKTLTERMETANTNSVDDRNRDIDAHLNEGSPVVVRIIPPGAELHMTHTVVVSGRKTINGVKYFKITDSAGGGNYLVKGSYISDKNLFESRKKTPVPFLAYTALMTEESARKPKVRPTNVKIGEPGFVIPDFDSVPRWESQIRLAKKEGLVSELEDFSQEIEDLSENTEALSHLAYAGGFLEQSEYLREMVRRSRRNREVVDNIRISVQDIIND